MLVRMICTECGREVKGHVCRACQAARTRAGILRHQRRFLQTWLAGEIDLRVKWMGDVLHLELFDDRWHSYCGAEMFEVSQRAFVRDLPADLCPDCAKIFNELVAAAKEVR
jgi:NMD protein affecting ribosome stability and mRNA decay